MSSFPSSRGLSANAMAQNALASHYAIESRPTRESAIGSRSSAPLEGATTLQTPAVARASGMRTADYGVLVVDMEASLVASEGSRPWELGKQGWRASHAG